MTDRVVRAYLMGLRPITLEVTSEETLDGLDFLVGYELNRAGHRVSDSPRRLIQRAIRRLEEVS